MDRKPKFPWLQHNWIGYSSAESLEIQEMINFPGSEVRQSSFQCVKWYGNDQRNVTHLPELQLD